MERRLISWKHRYYCGQHEHEVTPWLGQVFPCSLVGHAKGMLFEILIKPSCYCNAAKGKGATFSEESATSVSRKPTSCLPTSTFDRCSCSIFILCTIRFLDQSSYYVMVNDPLQLAFVQRSSTRLIAIRGVEMLEPTRSVGVLYQEASCANATQSKTVCHDRNCEDH